MKAKLLPLDGKEEWGGKYYGTLIQISDSGYSTILKVWLNHSGEPSDRELEGICTIEQWRANEILHDTWRAEEWPDGIPAKEACEICDCHYESRETLAFAQKIVDAVNRYGQADRSRCGSD